MNIDLDQNEIKSIRSQLMTKFEIITIISFKVGLCTSGMTAAAYDQRALSHGFMIGFMLLCYHYGMRRLASKQFKTMIQKTTYAKA